MSRHTPGPWSIEHWENGREKGISIRPHREDTGAMTGFQLACIWTHPMPSAPEGDSDLANARLISAAPDLLEALEAILAAEIIYTGAIEETIEACGIDGIAPLAKRARAAINKAKGVSNAAAMKREASK